MLFYFGLKQRIQGECKSCWRRNQESWGDVGRILSTW